MDRNAVIKAKDIESYSLTPILEEATKTYNGNPLYLAEMKELIENLDDRDKALIYLRFFGFSIREIAEELGISRRTIEKRLKKIRWKARRYLG